MCNFLRTIRKHILLEWVFLVWYDIANCKRGLSNGFHESKIYVAQTIYAIDAIKRWKKKSRDFLTLLFIASFVEIQLNDFLRKKFQTIDIFLLFASLNRFKWMNAFLGNGLIKNQNSPKTHKFEFCVKFYTIWMRFKSHSENNAKQCKLTSFGSTFYSNWIFWWTEQPNQQASNHFFPMNSQLELSWQQ